MHENLGLNASKISPMIILACDEISISGMINNDHVQEGVPAEDMSSAVIALKTLKTVLIPSSCIH